MLKKKKNPLAPTQTDEPYPEHNNTNWNYAFKYWHISRSNNTTKRFNNWNLPLETRYNTAMKLEGFPGGLNWAIWCHGEVTQSFGTVLHASKNNIKVIYRPKTVGDFFFFGATFYGYGIPFIPMDTYGYLLYMVIPFLRYGMNYQII